MKKIYSLIAFALLLFVGNAQAQRAWVSSEENVEAIQPGEENFYVIQEGIGNPNLAKNGFLNCGDGDVSYDVNESCVYNFIEVDKKEVDGEVYPIYALKNVSNKMYLRGDGEGAYTDILAKAYQFTVRRAKGYQTDDPNVDFTDWRVYSQVVEALKANGDPGINDGAEAAGAWVFCAANEQLYIDFKGNNMLSNVFFRNNWFIHVATPSEMSAFEKLTTTFTQYFSVDVTPETYPVGENPGCISQSLYDKLLAVYTEAAQATNNPNLDPAECNRITQEIIDVFELYKQGLIQISDNYYLIRGVRINGFAYDDDFVKFSKDVEVPESWNVENAKYIWKFEKSENEGRYYLKNFLTNKYVANKANEKKFVTVAEPQVAVVFEHEGGVNFYMKDDVNYANCNPKGEMVHYGKDEGGKLQLITINQTTIDTIQPKVEQAFMNNQLSSLVNKVNRALQSIEYKNGFTLNGVYQGKATGLVSAFARCNATETAEGSEAAAFDGKLGTYYHTIWHTDLSPEDDWHWAQVNLGKELDEVILKMSKREGANKHTPTQIALVTSTDSAAEAWTDTLLQDTVIYEYATPYASGEKDSTTFIKKFKFNKPVQHLRFVVKHTQDNVIKKYGPCWYVSEMRFYDPAECVANPSKALIPQQTMEDLNAALKNAMDELQAEKATQACYDKLEAALEAMWEAYPDPSALAKRLEKAQFKLDVAEEDESALGFYQPGAKAEFEKSLNEISVIVNDDSKVLTLEDIEKLSGRLDECIKAFNAKLNVPAEGVYRIKSAAVNPDAAEDAKEEDALDSYIASANADVNSSPAWGYKADSEIESRWNTLWKFEKNAEGQFALKNLANGLYMQNPYQGLSEEEKDEIKSATPILYSAEPQYITLEASPVAGQFVLALKEGMYVNASNKAEIGQVGSPMATWNDFEKGFRSKFVFESVTESEFSTSYKVDVPTETVAILSFPIDIMDVFVGEDKAYEVLGVKDNMLQLKKIENMIPAGTPFIVSTGVAEGEEKTTIVELLPKVTTLEDLLSVSYNYDVVVKNGLVSTPLAIAPGAGFGFFYKNVLTILEDGDMVEAASGFFNKDIPATTQDGDLQIKIDGVISGEGTAVENVEIVKHATNDVYTLAGVKVRQDVKGADAVKGLPKGIYIVGGEKVIVK